MTRAEAVVYLGISEPTLHRWVKAGKIRAMDPGDRGWAWYSRESVKQAIATERDQKA